MAHHYKCTRCQAIGYDFDLHKCAGLRSLDEMPIEILERVAKNEITEVEAWKIVEHNHTTTEGKTL